MSLSFIYFTLFTVSLFISGGYPFNCIFTLYPPVLLSFWTVQVLVPSVYFFYSTAHTSLSRLFQLFLSSFLSLRLYSSILIPQYYTVTKNHKLLLCLQFSVSHCFSQFSFHLCLILKCSRSTIFNSHNTSCNFIEFSSFHSKTKLSGERLVIN